MTEAQERVMMMRQTIVLVGILALIAGGVTILASEETLVAYAAPRFQETEEPPRPTPTNEPQATEPPVEPTNTQESPPTSVPPTNTSEPPTNTPESPTGTPESPTNTPESPTGTPESPTEEPKPTSKPKKRHEPSDSSAPTPVPPAPTAAVSVSIPSTGFGSVGGWTLGITGLILVCILVVARRLRMGKGNRKGISDADGQSVNHRHPQE